MYYSPAVDSVAVVQNRLEMSVRTRVPEEAARRREGVAGDVRELSVPQQDRQQRRRAAAQGVAGADQRELVSAQLRVAVVGERQQLLGLDLVVDVLS